MTARKWFWSWMLRGTNPLALAVIPLPLAVMAILPATSRLGVAPEVHQVAAQEPQNIPDEAGVRRALEAAVAAEPTRAGPYLQLARLEIRVGEVEQAQRILRTGLTQAAGDPGVTALRSALAEVLAAHRDWEAAARVLEEIEGPTADSVAPMVARLRFNAGLDARDRGELHVARESLARAIAIDPALRRAWLELAGMELASGRATRAREVAEEGLGHHPGDPELRILRASTLDPRGSAPEMVSALRDLRADRPGDTRVALSLAGYLAGTGELPAALALQDTLLAVPEPDPAVFRHVATFWLENRQADTAQVLLQRGVALHPDAPALRTLQGYASEMQDRPRAAAAAYATAADGVDVPAWLHLRAARVLADAGRLDQIAGHLSFFVEESAPLVATLMAAETARESGSVDQAGWILRRLALDQPDNVWLQEAEARQLEAAGKEEAAQEVWWRLAESGSPVAARALDGPPPPEMLRASIRGGLERLARGEQGVASSRRAPGVDAELLISGRDLEDRWVLERIEADRDAVSALLDEMVFRTDRGPDELARLRDIYPASALLARLDTRLALRQGRLDRARGEVERLLDREPGAAEVHGLHGEILEALARPDEARRSYARALEIDAAAPGAFRALTRLHGEAGTLETLLERVRRLRTLSPDDALRLSQEVELLHRLGRLEEARALADSARTGDAEGFSSDGEDPR